MNFFGVANSTSYNLETQKAITKQTMKEISAFLNNYPCPKKKKRKQSPLKLPKIEKSNMSLNVSRMSKGD